MNSLTNVYLDSNIHKSTDAIVQISGGVLEGGDASMNDSREWLIKEDFLRFRSSPVDTPAVVGSFELEEFADRPEED